MGSDGDGVGTCDADTDGPCVTDALVLSKAESDADSLALIVDDAVAVQVAVKGDSLSEPDVDGTSEAKLDSDVPENSGSVETLTESVVD